MRAGVSVLARLQRATNLVLAGLIALVLLYTFHRAVILRTEYFDGYEYIANARVLLGDPVGIFSFLRPPLLSVLELPGAMVARAGAPGSAVRLVAPHLNAALLSALTAAGIFWAYRQAFPTTLALLGTLFFVGSAYFVHYGAHAMADLLATGLAATTVALYLRARQGAPSWLREIACGAALGFAILAKYPLASLGAALVVAEVGHALRVRVLEMRRWLGIVVIGITSIAVCAAVFAALLWRLDMPVGTGLQVILGMFTPGMVAHGSHPLPGESWTDYGPMLVRMTSLPAVALAGIGTLVALMRCEPRDVMFLAWLAVVGGVVVWSIPHTEARYLLPAVPAILYGAVRAVEVGIDAARPYWPRLPVALRAGCLLAAGAALAGVLGGGLRQIAVDRDPFYADDAELRIARAVVSERRFWSRSEFAGEWAARAPRRRSPVPGDEYLGVFHFAPRSLTYLTDLWFADLSVARDDPSALAAAARDDDIVVVGSDRFYTALTLPPDGAPPVEVWKVRRIVLFRVGDDFLDGPSASPSGFRLHAAEGSLTSVGVQTGDAWRLFVPDGRGALRLLAETRLEPGRAITADVGDAPLLVALATRRLAGD